MLPNRFANPFAPSRRARPAGPSCRGGASSLLRLAQPASPRLPTPLALSGWMSRAADVLLPVTGLHGHFAASEFGRGSHTAAP